MEEAPAAAVEEGLPDDTRDAATSPMPSTTMPPLIQESSDDSDDDDEMPPLEDGEIRYVSQRDEEDDGLVVDVRHSLGRLTRLSARMRSLRGPGHLAARGDHYCHGVVGGGRRPRVTRGGAHAVVEDRHGIKKEAETTRAGELPREAA